MAKQFYFTFGNGNPNSYSGLSPTFIVFNLNGTTPTAAPAVSELAAGTGIYGFQYGITASVAFVIDGGATLSTSQTTSGFRYIKDAIDPVLSIDQAIGYLTDSFGSTNTDPTTLFGKANRVQEFQEGNKIYTKATGTWDIYSRGSSTLLREKVLTNATSSASSS